MSSAGFFLKTSEITSILVDNLSLLTQVSTTLYRYNPRLIKRLAQVSHSGSKQHLTDLEEKPITQSFTKLDKISQQF